MRTVCLLQGYFHCQFATARFLTCPSRTLLLSRALSSFADSVLEIRSLKAKLSKSKGFLAHRQTIGRPRSDHYCAGCGMDAAFALLPSLFRPASLTARFICRQSARVFSSSALHVCFPALAAPQLPRRSSRRFMPFVCADAGAMPASTMTVVRTPTPLQDLIFRSMRFWREIYTAKGRKPD